MAMTRFERLAIFSIIENVTQQLNGLKTLLAASGNETAQAARSVKLPVPNGTPSNYTDETEDAELDRMFNAKAETERLEKEAEATTAKLWAAALPREPDSDAVR